MPTEVESLVQTVEEARSALLARAASFSNEQGAFQSSGGWSICEILEHLYLAEVSGVTKIWAASDDHRAGKRWLEDCPHRGKSIEQVVAETWKERELAPPIATPHIGGPVAFWVSALDSLTPVLAELASRLDDQPLEEVVFPHFLSGPLDARQRLDFLRFHIVRHADQLERVCQHVGFPK
jgi:hypothetical protein